MMFHAPLLLVALVQYTSLAPSGALSPCLYREHSHRFATFSSALFYSNGDGGGEPYFSLLPRPYPLRLCRGRRPQLEAVPPFIDESSIARPNRRIPRRAVPHVQNESPTDAAVRAGYIIRQAWDGYEQPLPPLQRQTRGVRPLRRVVHQSHQEKPPRLQKEEQNHIGAQDLSNAIGVDFGNRQNNGRFGLSSSEKKQLGGFLDEQKQLIRSEDQRKSARRVTFKATRESSKAIPSKSSASLTEYMTQPVSEYSLLSFHDAEGPSKRWMVRRLTREEAQCYTDPVSLEDGVLEESNLFRLAVPLFPLIGWDLTPVIDLEVIPPEYNFYIGANLIEIASTDDYLEQDDNEPQDGIGEQAKWAPLRGIRKRIYCPIRENEKVESPPVVKIRSLRVSLLSTQEEVKKVMSNDEPLKHHRPGSSMQKEAIEIVGRVEEWLRPHIMFEAELSWTECLFRGGVQDESSSTVTVKSTAITSLTIPEIPSDFIGATVPSAFLVRVIGAILTSQALSICLPRFLRQLEKDYRRWSRGEVEEP